VRIAVVRHWGEIGFELGELGVVDSVMGIDRTVSGS
jgi:hypothetical protein